MAQTIPTGWEEKKICDICDVYQPQTISGKEMKDGGNFPVFGANGLIGHYTKYNHEEPEVLLGCRGSCGAINFSNPFSWINGNAMVIHPKTEELSKEFLRYYLENCNFSEYTSGVATPQITRKSLSPLLIKYPSLAEQKRIVKKLDKAFEAIDKVKASAEQNLNNAKEIYNIQKELIFKTVLENKPVEFGDIIELLTDYHANGSYKLLKEHVELLDNENYAWMIRSTDFENEFKNNFKYINEKAYNFLEKTKIFGNEIIMSKIGNAGKIYLMPVVNRPVSLAMNLFLIRVKEKLAISSYVYRFLLTNIGQKQINERCKGAATQTITKDNVRSIKIYLPNTLSEQQKIVEKLDALQEQTKQLEAIYTKKIKALDELKQSILQKAFRGEL